MHTKESLLCQLAALDAPRDVPVLVHTSLRAVGPVEGRADGFLDALIAYFTKDCSPEGGLLCIPTHTWANLGKGDPVTLDMNSGETCIGTLPSVAALRPDAHRSLHPTHSMAVFGDPEKAEDFIVGEVMVDTSTGPGGCYGKLYDRGGFILLAGVGHNRNTYLHSVEERLGVPNRLSEKYARVDIRLKSGDVIERPIRHHSAAGIGDVSARYPRYEPAFRFHGCIRDGALGDAPVQLCDCRRMALVMALIRARSGGRELMGGEVGTGEIPEEYYRI